MAEQDQTPVFQLQRMYLKDLSLEQPNSPQILLEQQQPQVDIQLAMSAEGIAEGLFDKRLDVALFVYQIVMFAHAWALKAWHFRPRMSVDEYVARGLDLMLNPLLAASRPRRPASAWQRTRGRRARSP